MFYLLILISIVIPVLACLFELGPTTTLSELHHKHFDSYRAQSALSGSLCMVMVLMGTLCLLFVILCNVGFFLISPIIIMGFFASFIVVMFVSWLATKHFQVITYRDYLVIYPFFGRYKKLFYKDIVRIRRGSVLEPLGYHSIYLYDGAGRHYFIWGALDVDNIMLKVNRFDVFDEH